MVKASCDRLGPRAHNVADHGADRGKVRAGVRAIALEKAGYRREFVSKEGLRCLSRTHLEIDHIVPRSCGGEGTISNIQVLCRGHNLRKAEHDLGEPFIKNKIANVRKDRTRVGAGDGQR